MNIYNLNGNLLQHVLLCQVVYTNKPANNLLKIELYTIFSLSKHKMETVLCEFLLIKFLISANNTKLNDHLPGPVGTSRTQSQAGRRSGGERSWQADRHSATVGLGEGGGGAEAAVRLSKR